MKKLLICIIAVMSNHISSAQWLGNNGLSNLSTWSSAPGMIGWYNTTNNAPGGFSYGSGIQSVLPGDERFGTQLVSPTFDTQLYYRNVRVGNWDPWYKIWSTANFDPDNYLDRSFPSISAPNSINSFINGYTFAYKTSGAPWNGALISYGGFGGSYETQINSDYGPDGGKHISFRTLNGDGGGGWNNWYELYHNGNINKPDVDFAAKTLNCTNVYSNGNIWAKEIKVALTNPWPDYVFKLGYKLMPLTRLKNYILTNKHLPEMPSETEVSVNGIELAHMVSLQTKKIEELTLYLIEKDQEVKAQQEEINNLKTLIKTALSQQKRNNSERPEGLLKPRTNTQ